MRQNSAKKKKISRLKQKKKDRKFWMKLTWPKKRRRSSWKTLDSAKRSNRGQSQRP